MFDLMTKVIILESNTANYNYSLPPSVSGSKTGTIISIDNNYKSGEPLYGVSIPSMGYAIEWFTENQIEPLENEFTYSHGTTDVCIDYSDEETAVRLANSIFAEPLNDSAEYYEEDNSDVQ